MKVNISSIASTDGGELSFVGDAFFETVTFCGNKFVFENGAKIDGKIVNQAGSFFLTAAVNLGFETLCARCGKPVHEDFSFELNEKLIKEGSNSTDEDAVVFSGDEIDVVDLAVNGFLMEAPGRFLCKEDCEGLCPVCGKDLNEGACSCDDDKVDPRFAILDNIKL